MGILLFLAVFFLFSVMSTLLKWSMQQSKKQIWFQLGIIAGLCLAFFPINLHLTESKWMQFLTNPNSITTVAALQIVESVILILFSIKGISGWLHHKKSFWVLFIEYLPSLVFVGGLFFLQLFVFNFVNGWNYSVLNAFFIGFVCVFLFIAFRVILWILPEWEFRAELNFLVALIQIFIAMFLPIIVQEVKVPYSQFQADYLSISVSFGVALFFILIGFAGKRLFPHLSLIHLLKRK